MEKQNLKKMNQIKYLIFVVIILAVLALTWLMNRTFVQIKIYPITAKLTIDNAPTYVNRSGVAKIALTPGKHDIKVEAEEYLAISQEVEMKKGKKTNLEFILKEKPEVLTIESNAKFINKGKNDNEILYLGDNGKALFKAVISTDGSKATVTSKEAITSSRLSGINQIVWSPNKDLALFRKNDGIYLFDLQKYDFVHQTENPWGKDIGDIAWAPDNSKIAYFYNPVGGEKTLIFSNIANTDLTRVINLADYQIENPALSWSPDSQYLTIIPRNRDYSQDKIYIYDAYAGTLKTLTDLGNQIGAKFSPDGARIIYSTYSKGTGESEPYLLSIMQKDGTEQRSIDLRASIENVIWLNDSTFLIAQFNRNNGTEIFSTYSLSSKNSFETVESLNSSLVNKVEQLSEGTIAVYENTDGVFAFKIK